MLIEFNQLELHPEMVTLINLINIARRNRN